MKENWKKIAVSIPIGALFLWLALKNVAFDDVIKHFSDMSYGWIPAFIIFSIGSYIIRAERWMLLLGDEKSKARRSTFNGGVMFGYLMNYIIPRLGEVSRCVYVSKKDKIPTMTLIGTVILERAIDSIVLLLMIIFLFMYVITDPVTIENLFGKENAALLNSLSSWQTVVYAILVVLVGIALFWLFLLSLKKLAQKPGVIGRVATKGIGLIDAFSKGLSNIKQVHHWPYFILLTVLLWLCYICLVYYPISMFNFDHRFGLGFADSVIIMILSAIGVVLPSPGALGTYHWFVKQTLFVLYGIPESEGLAYAFVTHSSMLLIVLLLSPIIIGINSFTLRKNADKNELSKEVKL